MANERIVSTTIPAPSAGWNSRDPLDQMGEADAIELVNLYPSGVAVKLRRGYADYSSGVGSDHVHTLCTFTLPAGTQKLVGANGTAIVDYSAATAVDITQAGLVPTTAYWQHIVVNGKLVLMNGAEQAQYWDGSAATTADAVYTCAGDAAFDDAYVVQGCMYKDRLYAVTTQTGRETKFYYLGTKNYVGQFTEFDVAYYLSNGGGLQWVTDFSQAADTTQGLLVVASKQGDILVYSGPYPGDATWTLVSRFFLNRTLGRRSYVHIPGDLLIITESGIYSMAALMGGAKRIEANYVGRISTAYREAAKQYGANSGWGGVYYPSEDCVLINVPETTGISTQIAINATSGAICKFEGMNAHAWAVANGYLYFGQEAGEVEKADTGYDDDAANISMRYKSAFSYFGDRQNIKHFDSIRPLIQATNDCSLGTAIDVDFQNRGAPSYGTVSGTTGTDWDSDYWDLADWDGVKELKNIWFSTSGLGYAAAVRMAANFNDVEFELSATQIRYKVGGEI